MEIQKNNILKKQFLILIVAMFSFSFFTFNKGWAHEHHPEVTKICQQDSLNNPTARKRNEWARECAQSLLDRVYEDTVGDLNKNMETLEKDENGNQRSTPRYFAFARKYRDKEWDFWKAPVNKEGNCNIPEGFTPVTCEATGDCLTADQKVNFESGNVTILDAYQMNMDNVMVLSNDSTLKEPKWKSAPVSYYSENTLNSKNQYIITITTKNQKTVKVTPSHPLINESGFLLPASSFKKGDSLVKENGELEEIDSITKTSFKGKVYSLAPEKTFNISSDNFKPKSQILSVQGFLTGSDNFQNEDYLYVGTQFLVPEELLTEVEDEVNELN